MRYKWNLKETAPEQAAEAARLAKEAGVHPVLGKLLLDRGLHDPQEVKRFFRPHNFIGELSALRSCRRLADCRICTRSDETLKPTTQKPAQTYRDL